MRGAFQPFRNAKLVGPACFAAKESGCKKKQRELARGAAARSLRRGRGAQDGVSDHGLEIA
jgi:hypothetical protein